VALVCGEKLRESLAQGRNTLAVVPADVIWQRGQAEAFHEAHLRVLAARLGSAPAEGKHGIVATPPKRDVPI